MTRIGKAIEVNRPYLGIEEWDATARIPPALKAIGSIAPTLGLK